MEVAFLKTIVYGGGAFVIGWCIGWWVPELTYRLIKRLRGR